MPKQSYGVPYQGSKNRIATLIMNELPAGTRFVDLMAGGCAMTHCAALSGKYDRVLCYDKYPFGSRLFRMAVNGELTDPKYLEWVSREEFHAKKNTDPFVRLVFSFGNNGSNYMYGPDSEPLNKAFHYAVVYDDWTRLEQYAKENNWKEGVLDSMKKSVEKLDGIDERRRELNKQSKISGLQEPSGRILPNLSRKTRLDELNDSMNRLEKIDIEYTEADYRDYQHEEGDVVYADPPYCGFEGYIGTEPFDHVAFYDWLRTRDYPVYFSEYTAPEDFISIW